MKEELVAQLDHHISTWREQRNAAKRCATLKEELVAGDLPILAVPFTTAMLSLGKKQMITYKKNFLLKKNYFYNLEGLLPNLSRMLEQLRKMSEPSATAPLRLMLVFAL